VAPCNTKRLVQLEESIEEWKVDENYTEVYYIKNLQGQILGYFSTDNDSSIHAEICEPVYNIGNDITVANDWYYWDQERENVDPRTWRRNYEYRISQDEGFAYIKVLKESNTGRIKAQFRIVGWQEDGEMSVRNSLVTFEKRN
jgi:hypothetical protein